MLDEGLCILYCQPNWYMRNSSVITSIFRLFYGGIWWILKDMVIISPIFIFYSVILIDLSREHLCLCVSGSYFQWSSWVVTKVCFCLCTSIPSAVICMNEMPTNNTWHLVNASKIDYPRWKVQIASKNVGAGGWDDVVHLCVYTDI